MASMRGPSLLPLLMTLAFPPAGALAQSPAPRPPQFVRGDANGDGQIDLSDAVSILGFLFLAAAEPGCLASADVNGDGAVDVSDAVRHLTYSFLAGPPPETPFPACGRDPS